MTEPARERGLADEQHAQMTPPPDSESDSDMPSLASISSDSMEEEPTAPPENPEHYLFQVLAQIEIASCFRSKPEPLFAMLGPMLWALANARCA